MFSSCSIARSGVGAPESFELSRTIPDKGIRIGPVVGYRVGAGAHPAAPWAGWDGPSHSLRLRPSICYPGHRAFRHRQAHFAALGEVYDAGISVSVRSRQFLHVSFRVVERDCRDGERSHRGSLFTQRVPAPSCMTAQAMPTTQVSRAITSATLSFYEALEVPEELRPMSRTAWRRRQWPRPCGDWGDENRCPPRVIRPDAVRLHSHSC